MKTGIVRIYVYYSLFGLALGLTLSLGGLTDFNQIHTLFLFKNIPLLMMFALAIGISMLGFLLIRSSRQLPKKKYTKGTIPGSIIFGVGWALTGACPSIALAQLGEGQFAALLTVLGILAGVWVYRKGSSSNLINNNSICGE